MLVYTVVGSPVLVRQIPSADAKIMNVLPTGSKLYVVSNDSGWLRTSSGYYVFHTDDVALDSSPAQALDEVNRSSIVRLRAAATIDPSLDDDDTPDIPSVAEGMRATRQTNVDPSGDDTSNGNSELSDALTEKYNGKPVKASAGSTCYQMVNGQWVEVEVPESLTRNGNRSEIISVNDRGYFEVYDENGQQYRIDGTNLSIADAGTDGKVEYTQFELDELAQENRDADDFIDEIKRTLSSAVEMVQSMDKLTIETTRTVFGMPYQFLPTTDPRPGSSMEEVFDDKRFGRKYMEKIVARAPVLVMQPGEAVFLRGYSDDVKQRVMEEVLGIIGSVTDGSTELEQILSGGGEYYSFRLKHTDYYSCINGALRAVAIMMGLEDVEVPGLNSGDGTVGEVLKELGQNKLGSFNWLMNSKHQLGGYYAGAVQFYINSEAQIQENFSTGTRPSGLASKINQISDQAAEAMFVMGGLRADFAKTTNTNDEDIGNAADDITEGALSSGPGSGGLLHNIIGNITTLLAGGKMHFPEIWSDSQFQRSYNVTIKLDSPDCDPLSIYLNIMVPLIHILGFVLPRSAGDNTYISPFLVRCFYKSMFHIDMGIITSCDVVKGDQGAWTNSGLPTQITVQLSIKDLYSVMSQSRGVGSNTLLGNPAQMDYLANLCGINVGPSNFGRTLQLWWMIKGPQRAIDGVVNSGARLITDVYRTIYNFTSPLRNAM